MSSCGLFLSPQFSYLGLFANMKLLIKCLPVIIWSIIWRNLWCCCTHIDMNSWQFVGCKLCGRHPTKTSYPVIPVIFNYHEEESITWLRINYFCSIPVDPVLIRPHMNLHLDLWHISVTSDQFFLYRQSWHGILYITSFLFCSEVSDVTLSRSDGKYCWT